MIAATWCCWAATDDAADWIDSMTVDFTLIQPVNDDEAVLTNEDWPH